MSKQVLKENVVVLTGASSGIGRELAVQLAEQGAWLVLAARNEADLQEAAKICRAKGGRVLVVPTDVTDPQQVQAMVSAAVAEYGRIDTPGISIVTFGKHLSTGCGQVSLLGHNTFYPCYLFVHKKMHYFRLS